jgi:hypothetical protein
MIHDICTYLILYIVYVFWCGLDCYSHCLVISWFESMSYSMGVCSKLLDSHYLRTKKFFWSKLLVFDFMHHNHLHENSYKV